MDKNQTDVLVFQGDTALKSLGDGKFGGYLVRFGTPKDTDLENDFFSKETDLGVDDGGSLPVYYQHGMDGQIKAKRIGRGIVKYEDAGLWFEMQLEMRDEYEKRIAQLAEEGKLGLSSGAAGHLVERESVGKSWHIKTWPIAEASLTPTPAEPRNIVMPVKSFIANNPADGGNNNEGDKMDPNQTQSPAAEDLDAKVEAAVTKAIGPAIENAIKALGPVNSGPIAAPNINLKTTRGFTDDAVKGFCHWVATGKKNGALIDGSNIDNTKAAMQGQTDSEGGYAVPDQMETRIIAKRGEMSVIRQLGVISRPANSDRILVPTEDTAATKAVVTAEEGAYDENEPTLAQAVVPIYKHTKLVKISEELDADAPGLDDYLVDVFARAFALAENYYLLASGTGSGQAQSMLYASTAGTATASASAITAAELLALLYAIGDGYADNLFLAMKRSTLGYIRSLSGNPFQFIANPAGEGNAINPGTIHGIQVYTSSQMPAIASSAKVILLGNPDFYVFGEHGGMVVQRNPYLYQANGQIGLFAKRRFGGAIAQKEAFYHLPMHS